MSGVENGDTCVQFVQLQEKLRDKLTDRGLSKDSQGRLVAARNSLEEKRKRFLRANILHQIVTDVSMDSSSPLHSQIAEQLTRAELGGFLNLGEIDAKYGPRRREDGVNGRRDGAKTPGITTLGLEQIPETKPGPEFNKALREGIEDRLFEETKALYLLVSNEQDVETRRSLLHPHLLRLSEKVSDLRTQVEGGREEMATVETELAKAISKQSQVLEQMTKHLDTLINKHYTGTKFASTSVLVQYMSAKCETIRLKLKCLELEIKHATYSKEAIKAIRIVRTRLTEKLSRTESELSALQNTLAQYSEVGPEFADLVAQYASILKKIQDKKWALQELSSAAL